MWGEGFFMSENLAKYYVRNCRYGIKKWLDLKEWDKLSWSHFLPHTAGSLLKPDINHMIISIISVRTKDKKSEFWAERSKKESKIRKQSLFWITILGFLGVVTDPIWENLWRFFAVSSSNASSIRYWKMSTLWRIHWMQTCRHKHNFRNKISGTDCITNCSNRTYTIVNKYWSINFDHNGVTGIRGRAFWSVLWQDPVINSSWYGQK